MASHPYDICRLSPKQRVPQLEDNPRKSDSLDTQVRKAIERAQCLMTALGGSRVVGGGVRAGKTVVCRGLTKTADDERFTPNCASYMNSHPQIQACEGIPPSIPLKILSGYPTIL